MENYSLVMRTARHKVSMHALHECIVCVCVLAVGLCPAICSGTPLITDISECPDYISTYFNTSKPLNSGHSASVYVLNVVEIYTFMHIIYM